MSRFHTRLVTALGVAWILDGLEITIASNVGADLTQRGTLHMSASGVADIASWYLIGEVIGALFFGRLSDKLGRRNYGLVLVFFFHVKATDTGYYFLAFAAGNLLGPLTIGRLFDTVGRKKMISGTYILAGLLLIISAQLFKAGVLNATTQTLCWSVIFFFASAGASAGYLTVSEIFPLEVRAKAIAVFFAGRQAEPGTPFGE
jgi:MFS family permease